jgi:hypothetical protein
MTGLEIFLLAMGVLVAIALIGAAFTFTFGTNYRMDDPPDTSGLPLWTTITTTYENEDRRELRDRGLPKRYPSKEGY